MSRLLDICECSIPQINAPGLQRWRDAQLDADHVENRRGQEAPVVGDFTAPRIGLGWFGAAACQGAVRDIGVAAPGFDPAERAWPRAIWPRTVEFPGPGIARLETRTWSNGREMPDDPHSGLVRRDFPVRAASGDGLCSGRPDQLFAAVSLGIDHMADLHLEASKDGVCQPAGRYPLTDPFFRWTVCPARDDGEVQG